MLRAFRTAPIVCFLALAALLALPTTGQAQTKQLPEAWFFPNRPDALKAMEGKPAPDLKIKTWIGDQVRVSDSKGKVVVVDFWATWCPPCMASIPKNIELVKKHKDDGLVFIGVHDSNSGWDKADGVVKDKGINYPVALDDAGVSTKAYNVGFWPTYLVIDRKGVVRGAGLNPSFVGEAVKMLLAEAAPMAAKGPKSEFPAEWFYGGPTRVKSMREMEGKPMPAMVVGKWRNDAPLAPEDVKDRVVVLHFFSPGNAASMRQAETLAGLEKEMGPQGVVVVGVTGAGDAWDPLAKLAEEGKIPSRLCQDVAPNDETKKMSPLGGTAAAFGVKYLPATIVIDRMGKIRATSVRADKMKDLASRLLAENTSNRADASGAETPK